MCTIGYASDVEGNLKYWNRVIEHSKVLSRNDRGVIELLEDGYFVYGGDTCDRGCGDLQILRELILLKKTYPLRVHLLIGNRDVNKLRFSVLTMPQVLSLLPGCYWAGPNADISKILQYQLKNRVDKVKWMLIHTMGSPYAFEYRRQELHNAGLVCTDEEVAESFCSIANPQAEELGLILQYLELAEVAVVLGDVMFVHGGIHDFNMGFVPHRRECQNAGIVGQGITEAVGVYIKEPREWCTAINSFATAEVRDYKENIQKYMQDLAEEIELRQKAILEALSMSSKGEGSRQLYSDRELAFLYESTEYTDPRSGERCKGLGSLLLHDEVSGYMHPQPGSGLIQYGMGLMANGASTKSVIYTSYLMNGTACPCSEIVAHWLLHARSADGEGQQPVRRLVVGHQPHADAPLTLNVAGLQTISTDSSYSANTKWPVSHLEGVTSISVKDTVFTKIEDSAQDSATQRDEWMSYASYVSAKSQPLTVAESTISSSTPCTVGMVPASAETRAVLCVSEVLFTFTENLPPPLPLPVVDPAGTVLGMEVDRRDLRSYARLHGALSDGSTYSCPLPPAPEPSLTSLTSLPPSPLSTTGGISTSASASDVPAEAVTATVKETLDVEHLAQWIGLQTADGWYVKAVDIHIPTAISTTTAAGQCFVLLAHSEGYEFKNKLVTVEDLTMRV